MKCDDIHQSECDQHYACQRCPAEDRKRDRAWWQERCERLEGALAEAVGRLADTERDLRAAREAVKTLGKCRRCDGTGKTRGICKDPRCGEPGWDHYCGEDEKMSCPNCEGTGVDAAARAVVVEAKP